MIQTQEEKVLTKEQLDAISEGQRIEQDHKPSAEFERKWKAAEECEMIGLKSLGNNIEECYGQQITDGNSVEVARAITVGRFAKYRSIPRIIGYLPNEAKDKGRQKGAEKSNIKQEQRKYDMINEAVQNIAGENHITTPKEVKRVQAMVKAIRQEGGNESPEDRLKEAAKMVVGKDISDELLIVGPLDAPKARTTNTSTSISINNHWKRGESVYLGIDPQTANVMIVDKSKAAIEEKISQVS